MLLSVGSLTLSTSQNQKMSCNGCRVLRKRCGETCVLRSCLVWIDSAEAQGHATLFLVKFYGRSDLFSFITAAPDRQKPSLFRSLLFEACGRTINPVSGVVGLFSTGKWHVCEAAVQSVLTHGFLHLLNGLLPGAPMQQDLLDLSISSGKYSGSDYQPSDLQISYPDDSESATNKSCNQQKLLNLLV